MKRILFFILLTLCVLRGCGCALASGFNPSDTEITINDRTLSSVKDLIENLQTVESLQKLRLTQAKLSPKQIRSLMDAFPNTQVISSFKYFGQQFTTDMTFAKIPREYKMAEIESFLAIMPALERFEMFPMRVSISKMQALMQQYPGVSFGWTVPIADRRIRNDATAFSSLKGGRATRYDDAYYERNLRYCPNLLALDLGHNKVADLSFLRFFPHLKVLILADNDIASVDQLAEYTPELEYLELFLNDIVDISPLARLTSLKHLNLCHNRIEDPSPLLEMPGLERCWISHNAFDESWRDILSARLPECRFEFTVWSSTGAGWRGDSPVYKRVYEMFHTQTYLSLTDKTTPIHK